MTLYEIDQAILDCVSEIDEETGELLDADKLEQLQMQRDLKLENIACWIKNLSADATAIDAEIKALTKRKKQTENKISSLKKYLSSALAGNKFTTPKCSVTWRKSETVEFDDPDNPGIPKKFMQKVITYKPDKMAIKDVLKSGMKVKGAFLQEHLNMSIK